MYLPAPTVVAPLRSSGAFILTLGGPTDLKSHHWNVLVLSSDHRALLELFALVTSSPPKLQYI